MGTVQAQSTEFKSNKQEFIDALAEEQAEVDKIEKVNEGKIESFSAPTEQDKVETEVI